MIFNQLDQFPSRNIDNSLEFRKLLEKYFNHWKWYIFSISLFVLMAFFYIWSTKPSYLSYSTILIKEQSNSRSLDDFSTLDDLGFIGSNGSSLENEIHILQSRKLMKDVVEELKLNIAYFKKEIPYDFELFNKSPIFLSSRKVDGSASKNSPNKIFSITVLSDKKFELFIDENSESLGEYNFDEEIIIDEDVFVIGINSLNFNNEVLGETIIIKLSPFDPAIDSFLGSLKVQSIDDESMVLRISILQPVESKGISILNNLVEQYNLDAKEDKNEVSIKTSEFLDDRLVLLTNELSVIESSVEQFRSQNKMIDGNSGGIYLESSNANERELILANTQLQLIQFMYKELSMISNQDLLPSNIGLSDNSIIELTRNFNDLVLRRNRILMSSSEINPIVLDIDSELNVLKNNLTTSLDNLETTTKIRISALNTQSGRIGSRIASVPKNERKYNDIIRQQETKNALYLFLLQKREEAIVSEPVYINRAKVLDSAYGNGISVVPNKSIVFFGFFIMGLVIPTGLIFFIGLIDTKVRNEEEIKNLGIPYLGDIPLIKDANDIILSQDNTNSKIAEAFRYMRTNINFMLDSKENGKTILITSTKSSEGKSITSINLAMSFAFSNKKTVLVGMDLRAPKISNYMDLTNHIGTSNYIKNSNLGIDDILQKVGNIENLDIINSGDIPPNPVELLMNDRVEQLLKELKERYEYIIIDTAPVGMVTDTLQISKFSDLSIYLIMANKLDKRMLHIPKSLYDEKKLPNMSILLNGSENSARKTYGYGYGYGDTEKPNWFRRILQK